jgi:hypothetical protein
MPGDTNSGVEQSAVIILQCIHMMMIDGCKGVIWPIWYALGWICDWDVVKIGLAFMPNF